MTTIAPNKVVLTCTISGKTVTWTNRSIIQKKIDQYGSLEAFQAAYVSKGANKMSTNTNKKRETKAEAANSFNKSKIIKPILEQGVKLGKMSTEEYRNEYVTKTFEYKDGFNCTVVTPKPAEVKFTHANENSHAGSKAEAALKSA